MSKSRFPQKLLVEGQDDQHVVWSLCQQLELTENFEVIDTKGIDILIPSIHTWLKSSDLNTLGIVVDADQNLAARYASIRANFAIAGIQISDLPANGLVEQHGDIRIGIWVMPNNDLTGMLEDFAAFLIPNNDQLLSKVDQAIADIEEQSLNRYLPIHHAKARIHTWLAWQEDPGTPMGLAITKRYLSSNETTCEVFVDWLRRLFDPPIVE